MSSRIRRLQTQIWVKKGKLPYDHDGKHGGHETFVVPKTFIEVERTKFQWPLTVKGFNNNTTEEG